jgi:methyltransferase
MNTSIAYLVLIGLTSLERLAELMVGRRNTEWSLARGGIEYGQGHWPWMVALHTTFLFACAAEVLVFEPVFEPTIGLCMLALAVACQMLRWWCIRTLGRRWNPRVIVIRGMEPVRTGPYRFLAHPNYVAVALEGVALPMVHGAWRTTIGFTVLNAILLFVRIRCENTALRSLESP